MEAPSFFTQFFMWMGPFKWFMILLSVLVLVLIIKKVIELLMPAVSQKQKESGVNAILFWGFMALGVGLFSQTVSLWMALKEIIAAADISPAIVLIGFYGSFCATLYGLFTLLIAALAWWLFRFWVKRLSPAA